jgi:molecular chaperone DnaJ
MSKEHLKSYYETLNLPLAASDSEVNQRYRELAKMYHPDNQQTGDAELFKKITEAKNVILNPPPPPAPDMPFGRSPFSGAYPFGRVHQVDFDTSNVDAYVTISFKESVLGVKKEIKYNRKAKCPSCNGQGMKAVHNGCADCGGSGHVVRHQNGAVLVSPCPKCQGRRSQQTCSSCRASGTLESEVAVNVTIPGGVRDGNILRLGNMGNFVGNFGPFDQYSDGHLHIKVMPDPELSLVDFDVVSKLEISLEEAVKGCKKTVKTIDGDQDIEVLPLSRNKDEVIIANMGVNRQGSHRVILDVRYPPDILKMVNSLLMVAE